jgi:hypothetical protein
MRYHLTPGCGAYGNRIWVEHNVVNLDSENPHDWSPNITQVLIDGLNKLCTWGGCDKSGTNFMAWEFPDTERDQYRTDLARKMLESAGYRYGEFDLKMRGD